MSAPFLSQRTWQFTFFSEQLGDADWTGKDVLDFGGNIGNILQDPNSTIDIEHYWCVDVVKEAIATGRLRYPQARWLFYDRYSFAYNSHGRPDLELPPLDQCFDYIVAYSVFTSTARDEMVELVGALTELLKPTGTLAFTFIDPHHHSWPGEYHGSNLRWRLERARDDGVSLDVEALLARAARARCCTLLNDEDLYLEGEEHGLYSPEQQKSCHVFYTEAYLQSIFPQATIRPPANQEMQHCCLIGARQ